MNSRAYLRGMFETSEPDLLDAEGALLSIPVNEHIFGLDL
jgi:hypothetical protein